MGLKRKISKTDGDGDDDRRYKITRVSMLSPSANTMPKEPRVRKQPKNTLVLDLDETLVHSALEPFDHHLLCETDLVIPVIEEEEIINYYVRQRPYLQMFLERVVEMFQIVVFTAGSEIYASPLLDVLDSDNKIISKRLYRGSCRFLNGRYVKDLSILGIHLANVAILDNSPHAYQLQVSNGVPIKSFYDDLSDRALLDMLPFLETLADAEDVRPIISRKFGKCNFSRLKEQQDLMIEAA